MKLESLVIVDQNATVNTFTDLVHTARQAMEVDFARKRFVNLLRTRLDKVGLVTGVKS